MHGPWPLSSLGFPSLEQRRLSGVGVLISLRLNWSRASLQPVSGLFPRGLLAQRTIYHGGFGVVAKQRLSETSSV